jgi:large conductance mechanosensitive channel
MLKGFREFLLRGNVIDLAVAVVSAPRSARSWPRSRPTINFMIVAAAIYFVVVIPMQKLISLRAQDADAETPAPSDEARLLTEIRDLLAAEERA